MCTVTFAPRPRSYAVAMNRDEQLARAAGLPPAHIMLNGRAVLYPSEPSGGTWMAVNESGVTLALINWYAVPARVKIHSASRGEIIKSAGAADSKYDVETTLAALPLARINPFRLIGIFPATREIFQWQWDLKNLAGKKHRWRLQQWIFSGWDEPGAQRERSQAFRAAQKQGSAGSLDWLRRLHRSHALLAGPYSTCMHRADAATVSETEVVVFRQRATMFYRAGSPCQPLTGRAWKSEIKLRLGAA
jgi:hypothetical protein